MPKHSAIYKKYKILKVCFVSLLSLCILSLAALATIVYTNYDYLLFKYLITFHYSYEDTLDKLLQQELNRDVDKKFFSYFDNAVISILTRSIRTINNDKYTYMYYPEKFKKANESKKETAASSEVRFLTADIAYLKISNFSVYSRDFFEENINELSRYPYLVIDLRDNPGGDALEMNKIASSFLPKGNIIAIDKLRSRNWVHKSKGEQKINFERIYILQNKNTVSASENFIAALKENLDNVTLIGETTFGKGIGQVTFPLRKGYAVKITAIEWLTPGGISINNKGITPDISYLEPDILEYTIQLIYKNR